MPDENSKLSGCYRVTDLPQMTDLNGQDLFLVSHAKDQYGNYESQSVPFRRLMNAVKNRGFKDEIGLLNELNETAVREDDLAPYAKTAYVDRVASNAKSYIDGEIAKVHSHANKQVLDQISSMDVGQFANDSGYLLSDDFGFEYEDGKLWLYAGEKKLSVDASGFVKDGMVGDVTFDAGEKKLTVAFNEDAGKDPIVVDMSGLVDTYTAGDGLVQTEKQFSVDWEKAASRDWVGRQGFQKKTVFRDWTEA